MADVWQKLPKAKGIEYYVMADGTRSYKLRAMVRGQKYVDVLGPRTEDEAREIKALLDRNRKIGKGPQTYEEMIASDVTARKEEAAERQRERLNTIRALSEAYLEDREKRTDRSQHDFKTIRGRHRLWIQKYLGDVLFSELEQEHIEEFVADMQDVPIAAKTIKANIDELGRLWKFAIKKKIVKNPLKPFPGAFVDLPKINNERQAFLTLEQSNKLLDYFKERKNINAHDYCLLTMYTGMRPSEIHRLTWQQTETGFVFKTKAGKQRPVIFEHPEVVKMLQRRREDAGNPGMNDLVFPRKQADAQGNMQTPRKEALDSFDTAVRELGFYTPVEGPKDADGNDLPEPPHVKAEREQQNRNNKIVFYSLRHTFASWLVQSGTPLMIVRDAMGHSTQKITERYSHLDPKLIRGAVQNLPGGTAQRQQLQGNENETIDTEFTAVE